ncbi:MAG: hypothetical protein R3B09_00450 [Nannocystaceae bacterium]
MARWWILGVGMSASVILGALAQGCAVPGCDPTAREVRFRCGGDTESATETGTETDPGTETDTDTDATETGGSSTG